MWRHIALIGALSACTATGPHVPGTPDHHRRTGFANETGVTGTNPVEFIIDRARLGLGLAGRGTAAALEPQEASAMWQALGSRDAVQWLGHASIRLRLEGQTYLIDPAFGDRASPTQLAGPPRLSMPPVPATDLRDTDAILITHDHYDHFEKPAVNQIHEVSRAKCIVPLGLNEDTDINCPIKEIDWDESAQDGPVRVTLLSAQHESGRSLTDRNHALWGSWMLESSRRRVYIAGDSGYGPHFAKQGDSGPVDLAIFNVGGYAPRGFNKHVHLNPEEAIRAADDQTAARVLIVHWGTYPLGVEDARETLDRLFAAAEKAQWPEGRLVVVPIGTAFAL